MRAEYAQSTDFVVVHYPEKTKGDQILTAQSYAPAAPYSVVVPKWPLLYPVGPEQHPEMSSGQGN